LEKKEVIKHSATIQISNRITLFQRKAWNVMLANAFNDLENKDITQFEIPLSLLYSHLGYKYTDKKYSEETKELLIPLMETVIGFNILGKDKKPTGWEAATLLSYCRVEDGVCVYEYSHGLRQKLTNPEIFARISLTIQAKFQSKYALALYELFVDYRKIGQTPWITLPNFRVLMGLGEGEYSLFKHLNNDVIKIALAEVNEHSNLFIKVEYQRRKRTVTALKFHIAEKIELPLLDTAVNQNLEKYCQKLKELGFSNIEQIKKKHSVEIIGQAFLDLDFEIKRRKKLNQSFTPEQQGGWLQTRFKGVKDGQYQPSKK